MTTVTTRAGFDGFRDRMCDHFGQLPDGLGNLQLHVEQALLDPDEYFTHRLGSDGHHVVYDPRQISGLMVRQFLGMYATFREDPIRAAVRDAAYETDSEAEQKIWGIVLDMIDHAQDSKGVMTEVLDLLHKARTEA
ncbi:hypothetical protein J7E95_26230 [Streptomyces sp. ISL-14]|nr:hypothetical protein [Streptomyces sp. ISL-14]